MSAFIAGRPRSCRDTRTSPTNKSVNASRVASVDQHRESAPTNDGDVVLDVRAQPNFIQALDLARPCVTSSV